MNPNRKSFLKFLACAGVTLLTLAASPSSALAGVDLVVESITYDVALDSVKVSYKNQGDSAASRYNYMQLYVGNYARYNYVPTPAPGQTLSTYFSRTRFYGVYKGGTYFAYAKVDYTNYIYETNESNNINYKDLFIGESSGEEEPPLPQPQPDLVIENIEWNSANRLVKVTYKNAGTASHSGYQYVRVANGSYAAMNYVAVPAPGSTLVTTFAASNLGIYDNQSYLLTAMADYYGYVSESNETNNTLSKAISTALPRPDLVVDSISYNASTQNVEVVYRNVGSGASSSSHYLRVMANGYVVHGYVAVPAPGTSYTYTVPRGTFRLSEGSSYPVSATVDYYNYVVESDETNNSKSVSVNVPLPAQVDFTVTDISIRSSYLRIELKNLGTVDHSGTVTLKIETSDGQVRTTSINAPSYTSLGTTYSVHMSYLGFSHGTTKQVTATIDYSGQIAESNESNNALAKSVTGTYF